MISTLFKVYRLMKTYYPLASNNSMNQFGSRPPTHTADVQNVGSDAPHQEWVGPLITETQRNTAQEGGSTNGNYVFNYLCCY